MKGKFDFNYFKELLNKKNNKLILPLFIALLGILLVLSSNAIFASKEKKEINEEAQESASTYKKELEESIEEGLSKVEGVGEVRAVVTLEGEASKVIAYNETVTENSSSTSKSKDAIIAKDGSSSLPYTIEDNYPKVVGVMIVAKGANNPTVEYYITESVKTLLGITANKIVVLPMENEGE